MATHSSVLAWKIPGTEEPGGLPSMGSHRVGHDSAGPHRRQPTRLPRPGNSPSKKTRMGYHFLLQCMKVKNESEVTQSCPIFSDSRAYQAPLSMGFSRQEYWSGVPSPSPVYVTYVLYKDLTASVRWLRSV